MKNKEKTAEFSEKIGLGFIFLFLIAFLGSMQTREITGLAISEALAFIGILCLLNAKRLRNGYIFCRK